MEDITLVYNPTFIALGNVIKGLVRPDLLLIACPDIEAQATVATIWSTVFRLNHGFHDRGPYYHFANKYEEVELLKLAVNAALGTKISLANSLGKLFEAYGVDPAKVAVMGNDPRIGKGYLLPGSPITGPCLPRDNYALMHAAIEKGVDLALSAATEEIQEDFYFDMCHEIMSTKPKTVGILGMSYKRGLDVTTGSVGSQLERLLTPQTTVLSWDPLIDLDDFDEVAACDVLVITQSEYAEYVTPPKKDQRVINLWF
jgi:UDPglucose 6-dehydrogenase